MQQPRHTLMPWAEAPCRPDASRAVINRYGFNNDGLDAVAERLASFRQRSAAEPWRCPGHVAVNLGAAQSRVGVRVIGVW